MTVMPCFVGLRPQNACKSLIPGHAQNRGRGATPASPLVPARIGNSRFGGNSAASGSIAWSERFGSPEKLTPAWVSGLLGREAPWP